MTRREIREIIKSGKKMPISKIQKIIKSFFSTMKGRLGFRSVEALYALRDNPSDKFDLDFVLDLFEHYYIYYKTKETFVRHCNITENDLVNNFNSFKFYYPVLGKLYKNSDAIKVLEVLNGGRENKHCLKEQYFSRKNPPYKIENYTIENYINEVYYFNNEKIFSEGRITNDMLKKILTRNKDVYIKEVLECFGNYIFLHPNLELKVVNRYLYLCQQDYRIMSESIYRCLHPYVELIKKRDDLYENNYSKLFLRKFVGSMISFRWAVSDKIKNWRYSDTFCDTVLYYKLYHYLKNISDCILSDPYKFEYEVIEKISEFMEEEKISDPDYNAWKKKYVDWPFNEDPPDVEEIFSDN